MEGQICQGMQGNLGLWPLMAGSIGLFQLQPFENLWPWVMSSSSRDCKPTFNGKSTCSIVKSSTIHGFATAMLVYQQVLGMLESSTICLEIV
jgi:hypothetical protein